MQDPLVPVESVPLTALIGYTVRQARGLRFNHVLVKDRPIAGTLKDTSQSLKGNFKKLKGTPHKVLYLGKKISTNCIIKRFLERVKVIAGTLKGHFTNFSINSKENYYGFNY